MDCNGFIRNPGPDSPLCWCPGRESNPYDRFQSADFKSAVSTSSTTQATVNYVRNSRLFTPATVTDNKKAVVSDGFLNLERDKRLELSTYTLARYRSTN